MNPYSHPAPQRPVGTRPLYKRKRMWAAGVALFAAGAIGGTQSAHDEVTAAQTLAAKPAATVTVTATATETAKPEPIPTVTKTKTKTVKTPGPTVTVTKAAQAAGSGTSHSSTSTCSIVSNSGNCYQAGQFCRNSDHGAHTTNASGARITCSYSSNAWRWTYS
ncbi:hypothetical protein [Streptomyces avermitilis]|uniref:hypothetical protein n=1 Tax=Streptomyces avermitilis TaxID=33903 RepID=UPI0036A22532